MRKKTLLINSLGLLSTFVLTTTPVFANSELPKNILTVETAPTVIESTNTLKEENEALKNYVFSDDEEVQLIQEEFSDNEYVETKLENILTADEKQEIDRKIEEEKRLEEERKAKELEEQKRQEELAKKQTEEVKYNTVEYVEEPSYSQPIQYNTNQVPASGKAQAILNAALAQIGVNQDCTMLVTNSLRAVGINHHSWPIGYFNLGYEVSYADAQPGDLVYFADGGMGLAHIAVYAGNGKAVHGGWNGYTTVIEGLYGSTPRFIRVA